MKFYVLSDNTDTLVGMRLMGIEGEIVHERDHFLRRLEAVINDEHIGVVLVTSILVNLAPEVISELKLQDTKSLIVEIPDRHGKIDMGKKIDAYVSHAIGVKLEGSHHELPE